MFVPEGLLEWVQLTIGGQAFDRSELMTVGLHGEQRARLDRPIVQKHGAGAALARIAADVRTGQAEIFTYEVHEQIARFYIPGIARPVDRDGDGDSLRHSASLEKMRTAALAVSEIDDMPRQGPCQFRTAPITHRSS